MTKKDYIAIAEAISSARSPHYKSNLIENLCQVFREDNPRFNSDRFRVACESLPHKPY